MMTSIAAALAPMMAAIPKIIGFLLILLVGWFIAGLIAKAVGVILRNVRFNDFAPVRIGYFVDQWECKLIRQGYSRRPILRATTRVRRVVQFVMSCAHPKIAPRAGRWCGRATVIGSGINCGLLVIR